MITPTFALQLVYDQLTHFAGLASFWQTFETVFGTEYDFATAEALRLQWAKGDFSLLPSIEVVSGEVLGPALGGYAASLNKIYLSESFLATATTEQVVAVVLEEIGHYVDAQVNAVDTAGDEGELFSNLVQGEVICPQKSQQLKSENDQTNIILDKKLLLVEQSLPPGDIPEYLQYKDLFSGSVAKWPSKTITYNFMPSLPLNYILAIQATSSYINDFVPFLGTVFSAITASNFKAFNEQQRIATEQALGLWSEIANINFVYKEDSVLELSNFFSPSLLDDILTGIGFDYWEDFKDWFNEYIGGLIGFPIIDGADIRFGMFPNPFDMGSAVGIPPIASAITELDQTRQSIADAFDRFLDALPLIKYVVPGIDALSFFNVKLGILGDVWLNSNLATNGGTSWEDLARGKSDFIS